MSTTLSSKYNKKILDHPKKPTPDALKIALKEQLKKEQKQLEV